MNISRGRRTTQFNWNALPRPKPVPEPGFSGDVGGMSPNAIIRAGARRGMGALGLLRLRVRDEGEPVLGEPVLKVGMRVRLYGLLKPDATDGERGGL